MLMMQKLGRVAKELVEEGERYQFGLLVAAAAAYVTSAWWIVVVRHCIPSCIPLADERVCS